MALVVLLIASREARAESAADTEEPAPAAPSPPAAPLLPVFPKYVVSLDASGRFLAFYGSTGQAGRGDGAVYGAKQQLAFKVAPIVVAGARAQLTFPDAAGWDFFLLRGSYETSRGFSSGGDLSTSSDLARQIGVTGTAADLVNGAARLGGVGFEAEYATFTSGKVQLQTAGTGEPISEAPLRFRRVKLEASYDLSPFLLPSLAERQPDRRHAIGLVASYTNVRLPRIVYLTREGSAEGNAPTTVQLETQPQLVTVPLYTAGLSARVVLYATQGGSWAIFGAGLLGGGTIAFGLPARLDRPDGPDNRVPLSTGAWGAVGRLGTDARVAVAGEKTRLFLGAQLAAEGYTASARVAGEYGGDIGFKDFFVSGKAVVSVEHRGD